MAVRKASLFTILAVLLAELCVAVTIAYFVAQVYLDYECSKADFRAENPETCAGGFPYPPL